MKIFVINATKVFMLLTLVKVYFSFNGDTKIEIDLLRVEKGITLDLVLSVCVSCCSLVCY